MAAYSIIGIKFVRPAKVAPRFAEKVRSAMNAASNVVVQKLAEYIARRAPSRHKTAQRLGAHPTGILEFISSARGKAESRGGGRIYKSVVKNTHSIRIAGIPFINKAFHALDIRPKNAKWLTIPIHRDALHVRARDIDSRGYNDTFFKRNKRGGGLVLYGKRGRRNIPLYFLTKFAHIKRDAKLLPTLSIMAGWQKKAFAEAMGGQDGNNR